MSTGAAGGGGMTPDQLNAILNGGKNGGKGLAALAALGICSLNPLHSVSPQQVAQGGASAVMPKLPGGPTTKPLGLSFGAQWTKDTLYKGVPGGSGEGRG